MEEILKLLQHESDMITQVPAVIPFKTEDASMLPAGVTIDEITIPVLKVGTVMKITPLIAKLTDEELDKITVDHKRKFDPAAPEIMQKHTDTIVEILCTAIHNKTTPFPEYMPEFFKANCSWQDLHVLINAVVFRMGILDFQRSTTTLQKVGLVNAEIIAAMKENMNSKRN